MKLLAAILGALVASTVTAAAANADTTLYSNNFDSGSTAGFTGSGGYTPTIVTAPNGSTNFLGNLSTNQTTAVLTLATAGYSSVTLNYSLYALLSQDGNANGAGGGAGDSFVVTAGGKTISNYTFANFFGGNTQSYCGAGSIQTSCAPQTGATTVDKLGYGSPGNGFDDAEYAFSYTFVPTSSTTQITFTSNDNEGVGNEFYGIDNVVATGVAVGVVSAAPEPDAWALMLGGVGAMSLMLRRHRHGPKLARVVI